MKRAAVLGAGAWGTALAKVLSDKGERVALWTHRAELAEQIADTHQNARYLPGVSLSPELIVTADLEKALADVSLVVLAVPSHALREVVTHAKAGLPSSAAIVSATKGIENDSLMLMREVILDVRRTRARPAPRGTLGPELCARGRGGAADRGGGRQLVGRRVARGARALRERAPAGLHQ